MRFYFSVSLFAAAALASPLSAASSALAVRQLPSLEGTDTLPYIEANHEASHVFSPTDHEPSAVLLTCMDGRILPEKAFGIEAGKVNVLRNAGGRAASAIPSILVSQVALGSREIIVVHHTDCGMSKYTDPKLREAIQAEYGNETARPYVDSIAFGTFVSLNESLHDDVKLLRDHPLINSTQISGWAYNVTDGLLRRYV